MVDRESRDKAAQLIRRFAAGHVSNFDYDEQYPVNKSDPVLHQVFCEIWGFYDDIKRHTLTGRHALTGDGKEFFHNCALFLESDLEYECPSVNGGTRAQFLRMIGKETVAIDEDIWPFSRQQDLDDALVRYGNQARFPEGPVPLLTPPPWGPYGNFAIVATFFGFCAILVAVFGLLTRDGDFRSPTLFCAVAALVFSALEIFQRWRRLRKDPHPLNYWR